MRWLRVAAAAVVAMCMTVVLAAPAQAWDVGDYCRVGAVAIPGGACVDLVDGKATGGGAPIEAPKPLNKPGGVLAAANGEGGSAAANAARAGAAGLSRGAALAGRLGQAGLVISAFEGGYWLGGEIADLVCGAGGSWLCTPEPDPGFVPNSDVVIVDAGWLGAAVAGVGYPGGGPANGQADVALVEPLVVGAAWPVGAFLFTAPGHSGANYDYPSSLGYLVGIGVGGDSVSQPNALLQRVGDGSTHQAVWPSPTWVGSYKVPAVVLWSTVMSPGTYPKNTAGKDLWNGGVWNGVVPAGWTGYAPQGSAWRPPDADEDPVRTLTTSIVCASPSGPDVTVTATSAPFRETDGTWPDVPVPHCPDGTVPKEVSTAVTSDGLADKPLWNVEIPDGVQQWVGEYPQCVGGGCQLRLVKIGPAGGDLGDCFARAGRCAGWFADPDREVHYECMYGLPGSMAKIALSDCYVYSPTFDPIPQGTGIPYGDPATGDVPDSITDTDAGTDPSAEGDGGACWPTGWGLFNPAEWVLRPVKCALQWAFVPRAQAVQEQLQTTWESVKTRPPVSVVYPVAGFVAGAVQGVGGACSGVIADFGDGLVVPCEPPAGIAGFIQVLKWIIALVFAGYTAFAIWSMTEGSLKR